MQEQSSLRSSLDALASFFVGHATIDDTLRTVSELAIQALPEAKFVGLTMMVENEPATAVFTDLESVEIDRAQYRSGKGPCIESFSTGEVRMIESTMLPNPWPEFSQACREHDILSTLSVPMMVAGTPLGAMNFYADREHAFTDASVETATLFAAQASIVMANSQAYWDARALGEQLSEAIVSRAVIEQAKGIIMGSMRCTADEAFNYLVQQSQRSNTKLRVVAQDIVDDTTRRNTAR